nr:MAG TPA: hypothetical protein [Caudoviricetes sp.]
MSKFLTFHKFFNILSIQALPCRVHKKGEFL